MALPFREQASRRKPTNEDLNQARLPPGEGRLWAAANASSAGGSSRLSRHFADFQSARSSRRRLRQEGAGGSLAQWLRLICNPRICRTKTSTRVSRRRLSALLCIHWIGGTSWWVVIYNHSLESTPRVGGLRWNSGARTDPLRSSRQVQQATNCCWSVGCFSSQQRTPCKQAGRRQFKLALGGPTTWLLGPQMASPKPAANVSLCVSASICVSVASMWPARQK